MNEFLVRINIYQNITCSFLPLQAVYNQSWCLFAIVTVDFFISFPSNLLNLNKVSPRLPSGSNTTDRRKIKTEILPASSKQFARYRAEPI